MRYILILALLTSCTPLYLPGTRNTPLFREQGEAQISGFLSGSGIEAQGAYALSDHVAVIGGFSYASQKKSNPDFTRKSTLGEIGIGYYERGRSSRFEVIAGYGFGQGTSADVYYFFIPDSSVVATGKMQRLFIQPTIGTNKRGTNISFTPRISWVDFSEFTSGTTTVKPGDLGETASIFFEPAATLKFKLAGNLFGILQLGLTMPISGEPFFEYQPLQAAIGIQIDTGGLSTRVFK